MYTVVQFCHVLLSPELQKTIHVETQCQLHQLFLLLMYTPDLCYNLIVFIIKSMKNEHVHNIVFHYNTVI